ncbi:MAG TPA: 50S ribosomal protein L29 [bacterium]|nr:50S ribosomal protein L29 [bacterium]
MKIDEILQLSKAEIEQLLEDRLEELHNLRIQHATHQLDNPLSIRTIKKDIAKIKTVLREYELGTREAR